MEHLCECGCGEKVKKSDYWPYSWNRFIVGHNMQGKKHSLESRNKIVQAQLGGKRSEETRQRMSAAQKGKKHSEETRKKLSEINKGRVCPEWVKKKISASNMGKKRSKESCAKIRIATQKSALQRAITIGLTKTDYCDAWNDKEYVNDLRGPACEAKNCGITNMMCLKVSSMQLGTHHKNGKENCAPIDIQTLCPSCHMKLHNKMRREDKQS